MYEGGQTSVRTSEGDIDDLPIDIGLHQGLAWPVPFHYHHGRTNKRGSGQGTRCMLFADDIILISGTGDGLKSKLEQ